MRFLKKKDAECLWEAEHGRPKRSDQRRVPPFTESLTVSYRSVRSSRTTCSPYDAAPSKFARDDPYRDFLSTAFVVAT